MNESLPLPRALSFLMMLASFSFGLATVPSELAADVVIYENNDFGPGLSYPIYNTNPQWTTYGDLLSFDLSDTIDDVRFHMWASGAVESNLAFFFYENNNGTVGNLLWESGILTHSATDRGRFDILFEGLDLETSGEVFVGVGVEYDFDVDGGQYLSMLFGLETSVGYSDDNTMIVVGGSESIGLAAGTPLEDWGTSGGILNNIQLTITSEISEPSTVWLVFGTCFCFLGRRQR